MGIDRIPHDLPDCTIAAGGGGRGAWVGQVADRWHTGEGGYPSYTLAYGKAKVNGIEILLPIYLAPSWKLAEDTLQAENDVYLTTF